MRLGPERKCVIAQAYTFVWIPNGGYPASAPDLVVRFPSGTVTVPLSRVRQPVKITAIASDRRQITIDEYAVSTDLTGLTSDAGAGGEAWIVGGGGSVPVRVMRVVTDEAPGSVLELAEPLPVAMSTAVNVADNYLFWNTYTATLTSGQIGATVRRSIPWSITWTRTRGASALAQVTTTRGLLHVVTAPFDTGLTPGDLQAYVPDIGRMIPGGQTSWQPQLDAALGELIGYLRFGSTAASSSTGERPAPLPPLPSGYFEDDTLGEDFAESHAYLTVARLFEGIASQGAGEMAARFRAQAHEAYRAVMSRLPWLDLDGDGEVDSAETDIAVTPVQGSIRSNVTNTSLFDEDVPSTPAKFDRIRVGDDR